MDKAKKYSHAGLKTPSPKPGQDKLGQAWTQETQPDAGGPRARSYCLGRSGSDLFKKCDYCRKKITGKPVKRYLRSFCSREHVASYFGTYVEETWDEVYWADFY